MIADLKPYAAYKDSGLPWLGQVPEHWEIKRAKSIFECIDKRSPTGKEELLTVSSARGIVPRKTAKVTMFKAESYVGYKLCWPGDLVVNSLWAWGGGLGVSQHHGIISSAYSVYRIRPNTPMSPAFVHEVVRSSCFNWELKVRSKGVWISRLQLTDISFLDAPIYIPPLEEQATIVRFLDWANGRLERTIRAKRRVIALLTEQKQAIIHRAVTRGLDPAVQLKPSGIPWLGNIPAHWELWRISRFARVGNGSTPSRANPRYWNSGTYPWLNSSQVNRGFIDSADQFVTSTALRECHLPRVQAGSLLVAITGQGKTRGMSAVLGVEATINQHIAYISPRMPVTKSEYLHLYFTAAYLQLRAASEDSGSTKGAITCEDLKRFKIAVPPLAEQLAIQSFVDSETQALNTAISRLEREIEYLREYRTRLVADVVTGKLDVREAAARLPQAADEPASAPDGLAEDEDTDSDELTELEA
jgi:type I restriction enzyme S subunit